MTREVEVRTTHIRHAVSALSCRLMFPTLPGDDPGVVTKASPASQYISRWRTPGENEINSAMVTKRHQHFSRLTVECSPPVTGIRAELTKGRGDEGPAFCDVRLECLILWWLAPYHHSFLWAR